MKSFFYTLLMAPLAFMLLTNGHALAQADNPSQQCDKVLDITDTASQAAPLVLEGNESLCLDSEQIATWFVDQGGWTSELTSDRRYWQLTPPGPTRAIFTLHLPRGISKSFESWSIQLRLNRPRPSRLTLKRRRASLRRTSRPPPAGQ